ncbi:hypothetical protein DL764_000675 [Monosporascus ibericus]|uniref:Peptidase A1 domain-containing protein n=1 Tax=Monosporascus ibericus TaxID=155417 RepID=A0A4Q4TUF2_9PEZI|nr:hypothetical protein DL764_000675 [Monosporascus ibericus]
MPGTSIRSLLAACSLAAQTSAAVIDLPIWFRNSYAVVQVAIGTPPKSHLLRFDTGSATTWVVDEVCETECANYSRYPRNGYNASASSTAGSLGIYGSIEYLGGDTAGPGVSWAQTAADGFFGLAFTSIAEAGTATVVETMMRQGMLDEPRFGIYYATEFNDTGGPGTVWRTRIASMTGSTTWANGTKEETTVGFEGWSWSVFDTGAGSISVPENQVDAIYASIGMDYREILDGHRIPLCSEFNSSWSVSFNFSDDDEGRVITLTGDQLARPGFAEREDACWPPFDGGNQDGFFLIGTPLLHQFYSVWDFGAEEVQNYQPRIGFGALKPEFRGIRS